jgi:hypothetical protein
MFHKRIASGQPGTGAASTERASPRRGKLLVLRAVTVAVLLATTILAAAPAYAEPTITTPPPEAILLSAGSNGTVKGPGGFRLNFRDEDILVYEPGTGAWSKYFDGSDHDIGDADLEDFEILPDGNILFTLDKPTDIDQSGACPAGDELEVDDSDVVLFDFGPPECFSIFLEGSDIGLTKGDEDIDALACEDPDCSGRLLISTTGNARSNAGGGGEIESRDEDLIACDPTTLECELFFDGSDVDLLSGNEDVDAAWLSDQDSSLWLSTKGNFFAEGSNTLGGDNDDIFGCAPDPDLGADTDCFFFEVFNGDAASLNKNVDGFWATFDPFAFAVQAASLDTVEAVDADDAFDDAGWAEAVSEADDEVDAFDFMDVVQQVYVPIVNVTR